MGDTSGFDKWVRDLVEASVEAAWDQVRAEARRIAGSMSFRAGFKSGKLRQSIRIEEDAANLRVIIRAGGPLTTKPVRKGVKQTYDYALAQEFGTHKEHAAPFFYPTWRTGRARARGTINKAIKQAIEAVK